MSFASDPGRDDGGLPPVNIIVPDDARELDRDVLAYRREMRARRRQERFLRVLRPLSGPRPADTAPGGSDADEHDRGGRGSAKHAAVLPLIAACVALSLLVGAMLSIVSISPAAAPTIRGTAAAGAPTSTAGLPGGRTALPTGNVRLDGQTRPIRAITNSVLALVPGNCGCGSALRRLADQAAAAHVRLYFVGEGSGISQVHTLTARYGAGSAVAGSDNGGVLDAAYHPVGLTVLLVYQDATARVQRDLKPGFQLGPEMRLLSLPGRQPAS